MDVVGTTRLAMPGRVLHVVAYDVRHPRRLVRALHTVRGHACGGQKSAHECFLNPNERDDLLLSLERVLDRQVDGLVVIRLDPRSRTRCLGIAQPPAGRKGHTV